MSESGLAIGIRELWEERQFFDFTIEAGNQHFQVHKLVAAATSGYFRGLLTAGMVESTNCIVQLSAVSASSLAELIKFMYTGQMDITAETDVEVLAGACYLQMNRAIKVCVEYMITNLNAQNCFDVMAVFDTNSLLDDVEKVKYYIKLHIEAVVTECDTRRMSTSDLLFVIENWPDYPELDIFLLMKRWIETDYENRKTVIAELVGNIRFCLLSKTVLEEMRRFPMWNDCSGLQVLVRQALKYHDLPTNLKILDRSEQSMVRSPLTGICFDENFGSSNGAMYIFDKERWQKKDQDRLIFNGSIQVVTATVINNFLVVHSSTDAWFTFDPRTLTWDTMTRMPVQKANFALVAHDMQLYTLGGVHCDDMFDSVERINLETSVEMFDFQTNEWSSATALPIAVKDPSACVFGGAIYVSGGKHADDRPTARVDRYNIASRTWESMPPMLEPRVDHTMQVIKRQGEEVIYVLDKDFQFEFYRESTNQWFACDYSLDTDYILIMYAGVDFLALGSTVFFVPHMRDGDEDMNGLDIPTVCTFSEEGTEISCATLADFPFGRNYAFCASVAIPAAYRNAVNRV